MTPSEMPHDANLDAARRDFFRQALMACLAGGLTTAAAAEALADDEPKAKAKAKPAGSPAAELHAEHMQWPPGWVGNEEIVLLLYPGFTALDLFGPHHMFILMMGAKVHLAAATLEPVRTDSGIAVTPTITFEQCPKKPTVLMVPGGMDGTLKAAADPVTRRFVAETGARASWVTSVCTGSILLGTAGLLKGYKATSHWIARDLLSSFGAIPVDQRVVVDRNRITGAGVTSGLDFGLQIVRDLRTKEYAESVQLFAEYDPKPPLNSGCQAKADPQIVALLTQMHEPFLAMVRKLASDLKAKNSD